MLNNTQKSEEIKTNEFNQSVIDLCFKEINSLSLFSARNIEEGIKTVKEAGNRKLALPFILTFCPAIKNLNSPNADGQSRRLIPLNKDLPRARFAVEELFGFLIKIKERTNINPNVFLIFADSIEKGAENMFENANEMDSIAEESVKGIRELFFIFDQTHPGLLQKQKIEIPKIRKQSVINIESGKAGKSRDQLIQENESLMFDPMNPLFDLWLKHLKLTRKDANFVATGWQNRKSVESIWNRVRFLLAEFIADGEFLPKMAKLMNPKKFPGDMPQPIFLASSTRVGGFEMESDGFNVKHKVCVIAPFHNIGRWTEVPNKSPWIQSLLDL